jgi:hypothetical protein
VWTPPQSNQLETTGVYDAATQTALMNFVGTSVPSTMSAEMLEKYLSFLNRICDYALSGVLNTYLSPDIYPHVLAVWTGYGKDGYDRTPLISKLQCFLNNYPQLSGLFM